MTFAFENRASHGRTASSHRQTQLCLYWETYIGTYKHYSTIKFDEDATFILKNVYLLYTSILCIHESVHHVPEEGNKPPGMSYQQL